MSNLVSTLSTGTLTLHHVASIEVNHRIGLHALTETPYDTVDVLVFDDNGRKFEFTCIGEKLVKVDYARKTPDGKEIVTAQLDTMVPTKDETPPEAPKPEPPQTTKSKILTALEAVADVIAATTSNDPEQFCQPEVTEDELKQDRADEERRLQQGDPHA